MEKHIPWLFGEKMALHFMRNWEDRFICGSFNALQKLAKALCCNNLVTYVEMMRQSLLYNSSLLSQSGHMLLTRPRLPWGQMDVGPARASYPYM